MAKCNQMGSSAI